MKHIWDINGLILSLNVENGVKWQKVIFQKLQKLLAENPHERQPIQNIQ